MSHIEVVSNVLKVEKQIDALMIKSFCTVEYDLNAMSFDRIATIIAVDLINPIVEGREFVEDTEMVDRLQDSKGKLVLYWRGGSFHFKEDEKNLGGRGSGGGGAGRNYFF